MSIKCAIEHGYMEETDLLSRAIYWLRFHNHQRLKKLNWVAAFGPLLLNDKFQFPQPTVYMQPSYSVVHMRSFTSV